MCTRRMWRVFTLAAPSLKKLISPFTDGLATFGYGEDLSQPYPFRLVHYIYTLYIIDASKEFKIY